MQAHVSSIVLLAIMLLPCERASRDWYIREYKEGGLLDTLAWIMPFSRDSDGYCNGRFCKVGKEALRRMYHPRRTKDREPKLARTS